MAFLGCLPSHITPLTHLDCERVTQKRDLG
jgi:hypothetical protein